MYELVRGLQYFCAGVVLLLVLALFLNAVSPPRFLPRESPVSRAKVQMDIFAQGIERYYARHRKLPSSLSDLTEDDPKEGGPIMDSIPPDPWGNEYEYKKLDTKEYQIICAGDDGTIGSDDDIMWPEPEE